MSPRKLPQERCDERRPRIAGPVWIGVDGGGTGSRAMVGDRDGQPMGSATGGPGLIDPADPRRAAEAVTATVLEAAREANAALPARGLWAGLAGAGQLEARAATEAALLDAGLAERVRVGTDLEAAHADAFGDGPGIVLVLGTGSALRAVGSNGEVVSVGGWGALLGDEGSGYAIGLAGLRAVVRSSDGREPPTKLVRALLEAVERGKPRDLVAWAAKASKREVAALSLRVADCAAGGDPVAARIVHRALGHVRAHLEAVLGRGAMSRGGRPTVAFVGGLVQPGGPLADAVREVAREMGCDVHAGDVVPERGALRLALSRPTASRPVAGPGSWPAP